MLGCHRIYRRRLAKDRRRRLLPYSIDEDDDVLILYLITLPRAVDDSTLS